MYDLEFLSPVNAGDINDYVYHVTAEFIGLHVHRRAVGGDVNFADDIKQEGFLDPRVLQNMKAAIKAGCQTSLYVRNLFLCLCWRKMPQHTEMKMFKRFSSVGS